MYTDVVAFMSTANLPQQHEAEFLDVIAWAEQSRAKLGFGYAKDTPHAAAWNFDSAEHLDLLLEAAIDLDVDPALVQALRCAAQVAIR